MKNTLMKLDSIFNQAKNITESRSFFALLHEFALTLTSNNLHEAKKAVQAKKEKIKQLVDQMPHIPSPELKKQYIQQYKNISAWHALDQIQVFLERYDYALCDVVIYNLKKNKLDTEQLHEEHAELMKYAITGECPPIFPTIEEYKQYMRRIIDAFNDFFSNKPVFTVYPFNFDIKSNALLIRDHESIKFFRNTNTSSLINYLEEKEWKDVEWSRIEEDLCFEPNVIKRTIRQINERLPESLPDFINTSDHPSKLNRKLLSISGFYQKS